LTKLLVEMKIPSPASVALPHYVQHDDAPPPARVPVSELGNDPYATSSLLSASPIPALGEARVRRRQASHTTEGRAASWLLDSARTLLAEAQARHPAYVLVDVESALLSLAGGADETDADGAASPVGAYINAHRIREQWRGKKVKTDADIDAIRAPWQRLRTLDAAARPAALLGEGRSCIAAVDGSGLVDEARHALRLLAEWARQHRTHEARHTFEADWVNRLDAVLDLSQAESMDPSLLRLVEDTYRVRLDELEEDSAIPLSRGTGFDPALLVQASRND
jgi:hypothetical protein